MSAFERASPAPDPSFAVGKRPPGRYAPSMAADDEPAGEGRMLAWLLGAAALAAWFALLWFMFGDVL
jgi:hypothetical protein